MGTRLLNPDEFARLKAKGVPVTTTTQIDDATREVFEPNDEAQPAPTSSADPAPLQATTNEADSSKMGTAARSAALSIFPGIAARLGGIGGGALIGTLGGGPIGTAIGGIVGALGTGYGANKLQEAAIPHILGQQTSADLSTQLAKDAQLHPIVQGGAGLITSAVAGGGGLPNLSRAGLKQAIIPAAAATTAELARQKVSGEDVSPLRALGMGVGGAMLNEPIPAIRGIERSLLGATKINPRFINAVAPKVTPTTGNNSQDTLVKPAIANGVDEKAIRLIQSQVKPPDTGVVDTSGVDAKLEAMDAAKAAAPPGAPPGAPPATVTASTPATPTELPVVNLRPGPNSGKLSPAIVKALIDSGNSHLLNGENAPPAAVTAPAPVAPKAELIAGNSVAMDPQQRLIEAQKALQANEAVAAQNREAVLNELVKSQQGSTPYTIKPVLTPEEVSQIVKAAQDKVAATPVAPKVETPPETPAPVIPPAAEKSPALATQLKPGDVFRRADGKEVTLEKITKAGNLKFKGQMATDPAKFQELLKSGKMTRVTPGETQPAVAPTAKAVAPIKPKSTVIENPTKVPASRAPEPIIPPAAPTKAPTLGGTPIGTQVKYNGRSWLKTPEGWKGSHGVTINEPNSVIWRNLELTAAPKETGGIGGGIKSALAKNQQGEGGFLRLPIPGTEDIKPTLNKIKSTFGAIGERFGKAYNTMRNMSQQIEGPLHDKIRTLGYNMPNKDADEIGAWLHDQQQTGGNSTIRLSPELQPVADELKKIVDDIGIDKSRPDSPWVLRMKSNGQSQPTPFQAKPWYFPQVMKSSVAALLHNPGKDKALADQLREDYINHYNSKVTGSTRDEAIAAFDTRLGKSVGPGTPNPEFRGLRFEEGIGLPDSWRETNPFKALDFYVTQHARDMAYHRVMESDPELGVALRLDDNGRGVKYPKGMDTQKLYGEDVKAAMRSYIGAADPGIRASEKVTHAFTIPIVGLGSQMKDLPTSMGQLSEVATAAEQAVAMKDLTKALWGGYKGMREQAIKAGSIKSARNISMAAPEDMLEGASRLADMAGKLGGEQLATANRVFLDTIGRSFARQKAASGDTAFFDKWGPLDWHVPNKYTNEELINHTTANLVKNFAGAADASDLPPALLAGSSHPLKSLMSLQRWSIGRYNRWHDNVWEPAKTGNIKPLIGSLLGSAASAGVINYLTEQVSGHKPREMSWEEYLNMGGEDTAYTIASKLATSGFAGILSDLAMSGVQMTHKEIPHGFNNMALRAMEDTGYRVYQFGKSMADRGFNWQDVSILGQSILKDRIQVAKILMQNPDTGNREERIARRTGYLPEKEMTGGYNDPFSDAARYKSGDAEGIAAGMQNKMEEDPTQAESALRSPPSSLRTGVTLKSLQATQNDIATGQPPTLPYYNFIRRMQGPTSADAALNRDLTNTVQGKLTHANAIIGLGRRLQGAR